MLSIRTICLHADDADRGAGFWSAALGYAPHPQAPDVLLPPDGGPRVGLYGDVVHVDLSTSGPEDQRAEVERLVSLGAQRVEDWPYPQDPDFVVLRDPEGNLFCVLDH
jgi:hypothetical protein